MMVGLLGLVAVALAEPGLEDVGRHRDRPVALVLPSPGLARAAVEPLTRRLERGGWDAWRLDLARAAPDPETASSEALPRAIETLRAGGRPVMVVGEGLGGRLAARSVAEGHSHPDLLALLGVPLDWDAAGDQPFAVIAWLASLPLPEGDLDLRQQKAARWRGERVLPLLLGDPLPPLGIVPHGWLAGWQRELADLPTISLRGVDLPVWACASPMDDLAPPEAVRAAVPEGAFQRLGYLNLDRREPEHAELLSDPAPVRALLRWARHQRVISASPG